MFENIDIYPSAIVFDLDDTLWIGEVDCTGGPPFSRSTRSRHTINCRSGGSITLFNHVPVIFDAIVDHEIPVAYASRTWKPNWAKIALESFDCGSADKVINMWSTSKAQGWGDCSKIKHMNEIAASLGLPFEKMVFFDNEMRNIRDVEPLGTVCGYCPDGLNQDILLETLDKYSDRIRKL